MIHKADKKVIVAVLGKQYTAAILEEFERKKIYNSEGMPYQPPGIRNFVNGDRENPRVEKAIIEFVIKTKARKAKTEKKIKSKLRK